MFLLIYIYVVGHYNELKSGWVEEKTMDVPQPGNNNIAIIINNLTCTIKASVQANYSQLYNIGSWTKAGFGISGAELRVLLATDTIVKLCFQQQQQQQR